MRFFTACFVFALAAAPASRAQTPSFQRLGILGTAPNGTTQSVADAVSSDGQVVVGLSTSGTRVQEAFRWTAAGGMTPLGGFTDPSFANRAEGVSASGLVVGLGLVTPSGFGQVFTWTDSGAQFPSFPGALAGWARDVSDSDVVVGHLSASIEEAFARQGDTIVMLGVLPGGSFQASTANGVSADGLTAVGRSRGANGWEAFRWTAAGGMVGIGDLPGGAFESEAYAASADGQVVVGYSSAAGNSTQAFRWTSGGGMQSLAPMAFAYGISADGEVVVGEAGDAMIWTAAGGSVSVQQRLQSLGVDLTGWTLRSAADVSADGTVIVGFGTNPEGVQEAWRAVLPRTPTAVEDAPVTVLPRLVISGNPLTVASNIQVELPAAGQVRLTLFDALGREVAVLMDGERAAGTHATVLHAGSLAAGAYVVRLQAGGVAVVRRLVVIR